MADLQVWLDGIVLNLEAAKAVATNHGMIKDLSFRQKEPTGKVVEIIIEVDEKTTVRVHSET